MVIKTSIRKVKRHVLLAARLIYYFIKARAVPAHRQKRLFDETRKIQD